MGRDGCAARAYALCGRELVVGTPEGFLPFLKEKGHIVSLVGGGGKTTLMGYLSSCFSKKGFRTVAMTTTKIGRPAYFCRTIEACQAEWTQGRWAICGEAFSERKLCAPSAPMLEALLAHADAVVIEADGAKRMACKAPAAHEPVILAQSDTVMGVAGLDVLGKTVSEACFRAELVQDLLGCGPQHVLSPDDLAQILLSEKGARKMVENREFYAVLNKCDDDQRLQAGVEVLRALEKRGHTKAILTCFPDA